MNLAIIPRKDLPASIHHARYMVEFFQKRKFKVFTEKAYINALKCHCIQEATKIDTFFTIGGDGTILYNRHKYAKYFDASFASVDMGSLGFMADIKADDIDTYLEEFIHKNYEIENRLMLESLSASGGKHLAINDIVIHRGNVKHLVELKVKVNEEYLNTFEADGLIFATPTGASAYSLAAGGPLVHPEVQALVITPIAPHTLSNRPLILPPTSTISVEYITKGEAIDVSADGLNSFSLNANETITIAPSKHFFKLLKFPQANYYSTVRTKLFWKGKSILKKRHY